MDMLPSSTLSSCGSSSILYLRSHFPSFEMFPVLGCMVLSLKMVKGFAFLPIRFWVKSPVDWVLSEERKIIEKRKKARNKSPNAETTISKSLLIINLFDLIHMLSGYNIGHFKVQLKIFFLLGHRNKFLLV